MKEFLRKIKRKLVDFDKNHDKVLSSNKIFITIMMAAMAIVLVTATGMLLTKILKNSQGKEDTKASVMESTRGPGEETMMQIDDVTTNSPATSEPPVTTPPATSTPLPMRTPMPVPSITPTPDPIVDKIEKPEDVVVNDTVMKEEDKKDDGKNNPNKGNNSNNTSLIQKEDNSQYVDNASTNTYTDNGFYMKNGLKYYAKDGETISKVGIDVSIYQRDIDWKKVKASGVDFVIIRLGFRGYVTGKLMLDSNFKKNIEGALDAGLDVGIYFFSQAVTTKEAVEEAAMCIKYLKPYKGRITYPVAIDTEYVDSASARTNKPSVTNKVRTDVCIAFCETIKSAGYKPMVYANKHWLLNNLQLSRLNKYDIWYAKYGGTTPAYDYDFTIWQYTGNGRIDGIEGAVDLNVGLKDYGANGQTGKPQETEKPDDKEPQESGKPDENIEPPKTAQPQESGEPEATQTPGDVELPQSTVEPEQSKEPQSTIEPGDGEDPNSTQSPENSEIPQDTKEPDEGKEPVGTEEPESTPSDTNAPQNTIEPENTQAPTNTDEPQGSEEPEQSKEPNSSVKPEDTQEPEITKEPIGTQEPEITKEPIDTQEPEK